MHTVEHNKCFYRIYGYEFRSLQPLSGQLYTKPKKAGCIYGIRCQVVWDPIYINVNKC